MKSLTSARFIEAMVLLVTILGTGVVYLDQSALNVALPTIQVDLRADLSGLQWVTDIYILMMAALMLIGGALGDRHGRLRVYTAGMVLFGAASVLCGLASSLEMMVVGRALQGVGGALVVPGSFALLNASIPAERRGRTMGIWGAFTPLVTLSGPILGGWLVDNLSWRAVFFINVPLIVIACLAGRAIPESRDEQARGPLDWPGVATVFVGLGSILFALIEGVRLGWAHPWVLGTSALGIASLALFVWVEAHSPAPLLPLETFRQRAFTGINVLTLFEYLALGGLFFLLTLNFQQAQQYSAFQAGVAQLPTPIILFLTARPVGALIDRVDSRWLISAGILLMCLSFGLFMLPSIDANYWTSFFPAQVAFAFGLGLFVIPLTSVAIGALDKRYSGIASGFNTAITRVGMMLAVAIFGAVMLTTFRASLQTRTVDLALSESARTQLMLNADNLGATKAPAALDAATTLAIQTAIRLSFVDGFRQVMALTLGISLVGLVLWLAIIGVKPAPKTTSAVNEPVLIE